MSIALRYIVFGIIGTFVGSYFGSSLVWIVFSLLLLIKALMAVKEFPIDMHLAYLFSFFFISVANLEIFRLTDRGVFLTSFQYARPEHYREADLVWGIGSALILFGVSIPIRVRRSLTIYWELPPDKLLYVFVFGFVLVFRELLIPFELPGTFENIFKILPLLALFMLSFNGFMHGNSRWKIYGIILAVSLMIKGALFSYLRIEFILPGLVYMLAQFVGTRSLKFLKTKLMIPIYIGFFIFLIFFETFAELRGNSATGIARFEMLQQGQQEMELRTRTEEEKLTPLQRASVINQISACVGLVNDNGTYNGKASAPLLAALIPRALWPEKPKIALGVWFAVEIGAAVQTEDWFNNSINMTIPGQLYLDFGWPGLIIGCILSGMLLNWLWQHSGFYLSSFNILGMFFGVFMLYNIVFGLGADLQIFITMVAMYLIFLTLGKIIPRFDEVVVRRSVVEGE